MTIAEWVCGFIKMSIAEWVCCIMKMSIAEWVCCIMKMSIAEWVCGIMKMTVTESNCDRGLKHNNTSLQQWVCGSMFWQEDASNDHVRHLVGGQRCGSEGKEKFCGKKSVLVFQ